MGQDLLLVRPNDRDLLGRLRHAPRRRQVEEAGNNQAKMMDGNIYANNFFRASHEKLSRRRQVEEAGINQAKMTNGLEL